MKICNAGLKWRLHSSVLYCKLYIFLAYLNFRFVSTDLQLFFSRFEYAGAEENDQEYMEVQIVIEP
jgi:hypothetical protein